MNLTAALVALALFAAVPAQAYDVGPAVGARLPALSVIHPGGGAATLRDLAGPKGVVLVFYRSARWCPYCQAQLLSLRAAPAELARRGYKLAAISYDAPDVLARFASQRDIPYPLLSDPGSRTIDAFGLRDPQYSPGPSPMACPSRRSSSCRARGWSAPSWRRRVTRPDRPWRPCWRRSIGCLRAEAAGRPHFSIRLRG